MSHVGCRTQPSHHIADVIHHFLSDETGEPSRSEPPPEPTRVPAVLNLAIAAAGRNPTAAVAAARLATATVRSTRSATRPTVYLRERPGQRWSAFGYVDGCTVAAEQRTSGRTCGALGRTGCAHVTGRRITADGAETRRRSAALAPVVDWLHLGPLQASYLADLEAASRWRAAVGCPVAGRDGLVWCLLPHEADSYRTAHVLGRLAAVCQPRRIFQLIFPASWAPAAVARSRESDAAPPLDRSAAWRRRCAALAEAVVPRVPITTVDLGTPDRDGEVAGAVAAGFRYAAHRLLAPLYRRCPDVADTAADSRLIETGSPTTLTV